MKLVTFYSEAARKDAPTNDPQGQLHLIIVTHNNSKTISMCLTPLLEQVSSKDSVYVYDNASTDSTLEILRSYQDEITIVASERIEVLLMAVTGVLRLQILSHGIQIQMQLFL